MQTVSKDGELQSKDNNPLEKKIDSSGNGGEQPSQKTQKRKRNMEETEVWKHFDAFSDKNGKQRARCKHCKKILVAVTSGLKNHSSACKDNPDNSVHSLAERSSRNMSSDVNAVGEFDQEAVRKALAKMCVMDGLPYSFVEGQGFRRFMAAALPQFAVPSKTTLAEDCRKLQ